MRKICSLIMLLLLFGSAVWTASDAAWVKKAQKTATQLAAGDTIVLNAASTTAAKDEFAAGASIVKPLTNATAFVLVAAPNDPVHGDKAFYLKQVSTGKYLGKNNTALAMTDSATAVYFSFYAAGDSSQVSATYPQGWDAAKSVVLSNNVAGAANTFLCNYWDNMRFLYSNSKMMNAWDIYQVTSQGGMLDSLTNYVTSFTVGDYQPGTNPGFADSTTYKSFIVAYANALKAYEPGVTQAQWTTLLNALKSTKTAMDQHIIPITDGYYYIVNENGLFYANQGVEKAMYSASADYPLLYWKTFQPRNIQFIYEIKKLADGNYSVRSANQNTYMNTTTSSGKSIPVTQTATQKTEQIITFLLHGAFNINDATNKIAYHAGNHSSGKGVSGTIVAWAGGYDSFSAWYLRKITDTSLLDSVKKVGVNQNLADLIQTAQTAYESKFVYGSTMSSADALITKATDGSKTDNQFLSNAKETKEGTYAALIDNNTTTYFHSFWSAIGPSGYHNLQVDLSANPVQKFILKYARRIQNNNNRPVDMVILATNDTTKGGVWTPIKHLTSELPTVATDTFFVSKGIDLGQPYKYVRYVVKATNNNGLNTKSYMPFFTFSEFQMYKDTVNTDASPYYKSSNVRNTCNALETKILAAEQLVANGTATQADYDELNQLLKSLYVQTALADTVSLDLYLNRAANSMVDPYQRITNHEAHFVFHPDGTVKITNLLPELEGKTFTTTYDISNPDLCKIAWSLDKTVDGDTMKVRGYNYSSNAYAPVTLYFNIAKKQVWTPYALCSFWGTGTGSHDLSWWDCDNAATSSSEAEPILFTATKYAYYAESGLIARDNWKATVSSWCKDGGSGNAVSIIDDSPYSYWHSNWQGTSGQGTGAVSGTGVLPQCFTIDMGQSNVLTGFTYIPRQFAGSAINNGSAFGYDLYVSDKPFAVDYTLTPSSAFYKNLGTPTISGNLKSNYGTAAAPIRVNFADSVQPTAGRYLLFVVKSSGGNQANQWASCGEFYAFGTKAVLTANDTITLNTNKIVNSNVTPYLHKENHKTTFVFYPNNTVKITSLLPDLEGKSIMASCDFEAGTIKWSKDLTVVDDTFKVRGYDYAAKKDVDPVLYFDLNAKKVWTPLALRNYTRSTDISWWDNDNAAISSSEADPIVWTDSLYYYFKTTNTLPRTNWTVKVSSWCTDGASGNPESIIDDSPYTYWHSNWQGTSGHGTGGTLPQCFTIDMAQTNIISGFTYVPRLYNELNKPNNGSAYSYDLYVSDTPFAVDYTLTSTSDFYKNLGTPAMSGDLTTLHPAGKAAPIIVNFADSVAKVAGRYLLFVVKTSGGNDANKWASCGDFYVQGTKAPFEGTKTVSLYLNKMVNSQGTPYVYKENQKTTFKFYPLGKVEITGLVPDLDGKVITATYNMDKADSCYITWSMDSVVADTTKVEFYNYVAKKNINPTLYFKNDFSKVWCPFAILPYSGKTLFSWWDCDNADVSSSEADPIVWTDTMYVHQAAYTADGLIPRTNWKATVSSWCVDSSSGTPESIIDDRLDTYWHSNWQGTSGKGTGGALPECFTIDMSQEYYVTGFTYIPRPFTNTVGNGTVYKYEIYASNTPFDVNYNLTSTSSFYTTLGTPAYTGDLTSQYGKSATPIRVDFTGLTKKVHGRYLLFVVKTSGGNEANKWASCGEFYAFGSIFDGINNAITTEDAAISKVEYFTTDGLKVDASYKGGIVIRKTTFANGKVQSLKMKK